MLQVLFTRVTRTLIQNTPVSEHVRNELFQQLHATLHPHKQVSAYITCLQIGLCTHYVFTNKFVYTLHAYKPSCVHITCLKTELCTHYMLTNRSVYTLQAYKQSTPTEMDRYAEQPNIFAYRENLFSISLFVGFVENAAT